MTGEGDFLGIGIALGATLRTMNHAWMCPIALGKALDDDPGLIGTFSPSVTMIHVERNGRRVTIARWSPSRDR